MSHTAGRLWPLDFWSSPGPTFSSSLTENHSKDCRNALASSSAVTTSRLRAISTFWKRFIHSLGTEALNRMMRQNESCGGLASRLSMFWSTGRSLEAMTESPARKSHTTAARLTSPDVTKASWWFATGRYRTILPHVIKRPPGESGDRTLSGVISSCISLHLCPAPPCPASPVCTEFPVLNFPKLPKRGRTIS